MNENDNDKASAREGFNRLVGLSSYAMGVVLVGLFLFGIYEDGLRGLQGLGIIAAGAFICFGLGYSTSRKKSS